MEQRYCFFYIFTINIDKKFIFIDQKPFFIDKKAEKGC